MSYASRMHACMLAWLPVLDASLGLPDHRPSFSTRRSNALAIPSHPIPSARSGHPQTASPDRVVRVCKRGCNAASIREAQPFRDLTRPPQLRRIFPAGGIQEQPPACPVAPGARPSKTPLAVRYCMHRGLRRPSSHIRLLASSSLPSNLLPVVSNR